MHLCYLCIFESRMNISEFKSSATTILSSIYPKYELDTILAWLIEDCMQLTTAQQLINSAKNISPENLEILQGYVHRLSLFEPIQYIIGSCLFYGLDLQVDKRALIPRPETELLVDLIIKNRSTHSPHILDIGTGSGAIALALKKNISAAQITAIDFSSDALNLAKTNASKLQLQVDFMYEDIIHPSQQLCDMKFNILVSNPPYITYDEKETMRNNVLDYEPHQALFVQDGDPLQFYKAICRFVKENTSNHIQLFLELNEAFSSDVKSIYISNGFQNIQLHNDQYNKTRFLTAYHSI